MTPETFRTVKWIVLIITIASFIVMVYAVNKSKDNLFDAGNLKKFGWSFIIFLVFLGILIGMHFQKE